MRVAPRPRFLALVAARRRFPHARPDAAALALARLVVAEVVHELVQRDSRRGSIRGKRPSAGLLRRRREGSAPAGEKSCGVHMSPSLVVRRRESSFLFSNSYLD